MKTMLIGWDAADWEVAMPFLRSGKMPALASLMNQGIHANLATLDPPISPMLWTSIATSKWPSEHGIHGFTEWHEGGVRAVRGTSVKVPFYWDYLEAAGIPSTTVGWWPSHPAPESRLGGVRISNLAASEEARWIHDGLKPTELQPLAALLLIKPEEVPASAIASFFPNQDLDSKDDVVRSVLKIVTHALNVQMFATLALEAAQEGHASIYFDALDHFMHLGMKYHPPKLANVSSEDFERYRYIVESAYRMHDTMLDCLLKHQENASIMLVSDHGFRSGQSRFVVLPDHAGAPALEHRHYGMFVLKTPSVKNPDTWSGLNLLDVAPMVLGLHGLQAPVDFRGTLPSQWYIPVEKPVPPALRASSEEQSMPKPSVEGALLETLVNLGYLDAINLKEEEGRLLENSYYLARSLRAEGRPLQAWQQLERLELGPQSPVRYLQLGASLLAESRQFEALSDLLQWLPKEGAGSVRSYYEQLVLLSRGGALELPASLRNPTPETLPSAEEVVLWGRLLLKAQRFEELEALLVGTEDRRPDVLNLWMSVHLNAKRWEAALEVGLESTEALFHQWRIHAAVAYCFEVLGMKEEAATARAVSARTSNAGAPTPLFIVSGPPRSGTSLAMQLLHAAGVEPVTDAVRGADQHNAAGYWEHEAIKNWSFDAQWLNEQRGKAVKIVYPLLRQAPLPEGKKVVVLMKREVQSVLQSQRKMAGAMGAPLQWDEPNRWQSEHEKHLMALAMDPHSEVVELSYEALLDAAENGIASEDLHRALEVLNKYCVKTVDISLIASVVRSQLRTF
jgi:tetratricopeptide (TPR) repeat protein